MPITYNGNEIKKLIFIDSAGSTKEVKSLVLNGNPAVPVNPKLPLVLSCDIVRYYAGNPGDPSLIPSLPISASNRTGLRIKNTSGRSVFASLGGSLYGGSIADGAEADLKFPTANTQHTLELLANNGGVQPEVGFTKSDADTKAGAQLLAPERYTDPDAHSWEDEPGSYEGHHVYNPNFYPVYVHFSDGKGDNLPYGEQYEIKVTDLNGTTRSDAKINAGETVIINQNNNVDVNFTGNIHFSIAASATGFSNSAKREIGFCRYKPPAITYNYSLNGDSDSTTPTATTDGIYIQNTSNSEFFVDIKNVSSGKLIVDKKRVAPAEVNNGIAFPLPANTKFEVTVYGLNYDGKPLLTEKQTIATFTTGNKFNKPDYSCGTANSWKEYYISNDNFHGVEMHVRPDDSQLQNFCDFDYLGGKFSDTNSSFFDMFTGSSGTTKYFSAMGTDGYSNSDEISMTFTGSDPGDTPQPTTASAANARILATDGDFTLYSPNIANTKSADSNTK